MEIKTGEQILSDRGLKLYPLDNCPSDYGLMDTCQKSYGNPVDQYEYCCECIRAAEETLYHDQGNGVYVPVESGEDNAI